ncbi:MAG: DHA2 family efflux MFS transporter permease subunit [Ottowia sp.]|uniref:DHA2 family efflux MFS transporter permease subunit n=1 Tax=Ottowia sp. TaxID=1898956 RepID=UPI003C72BAEF
MQVISSVHASDAAHLRYAWRVLAVTALGVSLCFINASTLNVALPLMASELGASPEQGAWILLSYMLVLTALIMIFGRLSDMLGRKRLYLAGLVVLTLASLGCGLAADASTMLVFRCLQAVGAASVIGNTSALITDAFPPRALGLGLGVNSTLSAISQSVGPIFGGFLILHAGWRNIFFLNLPIGLLAIVCASLVLRGSQPRASERFDWWGAALSSLALSCLVYALSVGGTQGWSSPHVMWPLGVGVVSLGGFLLLQGRCSYPLMDLKLFANQERATAYACVFLLCLAQTSSALLLALFRQNVQGVDAFAAGLSVAPLPLGMMLASSLTGKLLGEHRGLKLSTAGLLLNTAGLTWLALWLKADTGWISMACGLGLVGLGTGMFQTSNNSVIMVSVVTARRGIANAVRSTLQNAGMVVGAALGLSLAFSGLPSDMHQAVYSGSALQGSAALGDFILGCRLAFATLALCSFAGFLLSLWAHRGVDLPSLSPFN